MDIKQLFHLSQNNLNNFISLFKNDFSLSNNYLELENFGIENFHSINFDISFYIFNYLIANNHNISLNLYRIGLLYEFKRDFNNAILYYEKSISQDRYNYLPIVNVTAILIEQKKFDEANFLLDKYIEINDKVPEIWNNKGILLKTLNFFEDSILCFDCCIALNSNFIKAFYNKASIYTLLHDHKNSINCLMHCLRISPNDFDSNLAIAQNFISINSPSDALSYLISATLSKPDSFDALIALGHTYYLLKNIDVSLNTFNKAFDINPTSAELNANIGAIYQIKKNYEEAIKFIKISLSLNSNLDFLNGNLSFLKKSLIDWSDYDPFHQSILNKISYCDNVIQPFNFLSVSDSLELQLKVSQDWSFRRCPPSFITSNFSLSSKPKIRIGYFSSDFRHHPVSYLIIELLELHNRDQFEIFGFSLSPLSPSGSDSFLQRLDDSFDHIFDVSQFSDLSIVEFVKSHEIDIAVDLNGHTQDARTNIFAQRLAPIQINYLGYPGTMGSNYYDFLIADIQTIPTQSVRFYSENIIYLPELFQVFDTKRVVNKKLTRLSLGLPEDAIIFCCFNNNYKFSPIIFNSWIEILKGVKNSVLWLLADNQTAATNLKNEFLKTDLDPHRLIICYRTGYEEYLSRYCVADLFLDTFPFNAGTTANDCLWMGLPILTYAGESFASRMASSLLKACNIPELITYSINDYIEKGIKLGNNPNQIREYKKYLTDQKQKKQLWDMKKQTKNIELGYIECFKQYQKNKKLEEIIIKNE